ncbi:uncharacterized protein LOC132577997 [Heteronotia binoei]|uniref:uncharacterized protein LOC132577997 n=1 Tax=Heteronotia binoei TaxID=13085 RepID=UPI002930042E|nr:uncharacterized protein LOC132577997 [Heteronotia binoei]
MREGTSSYTVSSDDLATASALRKALGPPSGSSAGGMSEWMKQFSQPASGYFQSNPDREKSFHNTSSQSSYPAWHHQLNSTEKHDNQMADAGVRRWDSMRDSYSATREYPAGCSSKDFPSWYNDGNGKSLPAASNSVGWPQSSRYQQPNLQADGKAYQIPFSGNSSYSDYQQPNRELNNRVERSPSGLSSDIMSQLRGKDPAVLTRMLQELVPHYPDLQKIDIYALAQALSKIN